MICSIKIFESRLIQPIVRKLILVKESNEISGKCLDFKPTGSVFLLFLYSGTLTMRPGEAKQFLVPGGYLVGQVHQKIIQIFLNKNCLFTLIEFNPVALFKFLNIPLANYTDKITPLDHEAIDSLIKQVCSNDETEVEHTYIGNFFKSRIPLNQLKIDRLFLLTQWVDQQNKKITVREIADFLNCCERQTERLFQKKIGISPKFYLKCIQMRQIVNMVMDKGDKSLLDILYEKGHYDAPHFNKDFKRIMKMTPLEFLKEEETFVKQIMRLENLS